MFAIRVAVFLISVLLASHATAPDDGWFIALAVLSGLSILGWEARAARLYLGRPRRFRWQDGW